MKMKKHAIKTNGISGAVTKPVSVASNARRAFGPISGSALALAALLPLATLTGCASYSKDNFTVGSVHHTYKTRHPIVIDEREQTLDLPIGSDIHKISHATEGAIEGFAYRFRKSAAGRITIMLPSGSPNEASARSVSSSVTKAIMNSGVARNQIQTTTYYAAEHGSSAPIRLSYMAVKSSVTGCGQWPDDLASSNNDNKNYHNFGCASQSNLATAIANPADLLGPRGMSPIDAGNRVNAIEKYREGAVDLPRSSTTNINF